LAAAATRAAVVPGLERASELLPYSRSSERLMQAKYIDSDRLKPSWNKASRG
jgi:hypothetical protein